MATGSAQHRGSFSGMSLALSLWSSVAVTSLVTILVAFLIGSWTWGLLDDPGLVMLEGTVWQRTCYFFQSWQNAGIFRPVSALHVGLFYKIFGNNPQSFYVLRWIEVTLALGLWGYWAFLITRRILAVPLLVCIALSFYKFFDALFYLSTPEILGVFFSGCAGIAFFKGLTPAIARQGAVAWSKILWGLVWLWCAWGSREAFVTVGLAWGISLIVLGLEKPRTRSLWLSGLIGLALSWAYGLWVKICVIKGPAFSPGFSGLDRIGTNGLLWLRHDLWAHIPWLVAAFVLLIMVKGDRGRSGHVRKWAVWFGIVNYVVYVLVLWLGNAGGHYATPLGVFFAFGITVLIVERLERVGTVLQVTLAGMALMLNLMVGGRALQAASIHQQDTANLLRWLAGNVQFEYEVGAGSVVRTNAGEPGNAIPQLVQLLYGKSYKPFILTSAVREILADAKTRYYLYGPHWGDQDLSRLGKIWYPVFTSKNWIMFRRLY